MRWNAPDENANENGVFRKRFLRWKLKKADRFENASVLVWSGKKGNVKSVTRKRFQSKDRVLIAGAQLYTCTIPGLSRFHRISCVFSSG